MDVLQTEASKSSMKVINDRVLIESDEMEYQQTDKAVSDCLRSGKLVLPEEYEYAIKKVTGWGKIIAWGDKCSYRWQNQMRVHFAVPASVKVKIEGKEYRLVREYDIDLYESHD